MYPVIQLHRLSLVAADLCTAPNVGSPAERSAEIKIIIFHLQFCVWFQDCNCSFGIFSKSQTRSQIQFFHRNRDKSYTTSLAFSLGLANLGAARRLTDGRSTPSSARPHTHQSRRGELEQNRVGGECRLSVIPSPQLYLAKTNSCWCDAFFFPPPSHMSVNTFDADRRYDVLSAA